MTAIFLKDLKRSSLMALFFIIMMYGLKFVMPSESGLFESSYAMVSIIRIYAMMVVMLVYGSMMHVEKYEDKYKAYEMFKQYPVTPAEIITGKFAVYLIWSVVGIAVAAVALPVVFPGIGNIRIIIAQLTFSSGLSLAAAGCIYLGISRFGYGKMKIWIMLVYLFMLISPSLSSFLRLVLSDGDGMHDVVSLLERTNIPLMAALFVLIFAAEWYLAVRSTKAEVRM